MVKATFRYRSLRISFADVLCNLCILAAATAAIPLALLFAFSVSVLTIVFAFFKGMTKSSLLLAAFLVYCTVSGLLCGGISLSDFAEMEFYGGEGRLYLSYIPFLAAVLLRTTKPQIQLMLRCAAVITLVTLPIALLELVRPGVLLPTFGTRSHHGPGGLYGCLALLFCVRSVRLGSLGDALLGLCALLPIAASSSRTAILGLMIALLFVLLKVGKLQLLVRALIMASVAISVAMFASSRSFERIASMFQRSTYEAAWNHAKSSNWHPDIDLQEDLQGSLDGAEWNVLGRVSMSKYALQLFIDSPIVGAGFGRFNDTDQRDGVEGLFYVNTRAPRTIHHLTAHNSILQFLCELGVLGTMLLLCFWFVVYRQIERSRVLALQYQDREAEWLHLAAQATVVFVFSVGVVSHSLGAPAFMLPVVGIVGYAVTISGTKYGNIHQHDGSDSKFHVLTGQENSPEELAKVEVSVDGLNRS